MVARFLDAYHQAAWVTGDEVYGGNPTLRAALYEADPRRRPLDYDEVQALFDAADARPAKAPTRA